jgi:hypothetical protein
MVIKMAASEIEKIERNVATLRYEAKLDREA